MMSRHVCNRSERGQDHHQRVICSFNKTMHLPHNLTKTNSRTHSAFTSSFLFEWLRMTGRVPYRALGGLFSWAISGSREGCFRRHPRNLFCSWEAWKAATGMTPRACLGCLETVSRACMAKGPDQKACTDAGACKGSGKAEGLPRIRSGTGKWDNRVTKVQAPICLDCHAEGAPDGSLKSRQRCPGELSYHECWEFLSNASQAHATS